MWPHRRQPTRPPHPWESPGKNTGVGCHFLLQCMKVKSESEVTQLCPTVSDPVDCSLPGSSVHGIFQARVLAWGAIAFLHLFPLVTTYLLSVFVSFFFVIFTSLLHFLDSTYKWCQYLSVFNLFHLAWCHPSPSMLLLMAGFHSSFTAEECTHTCTPHPYDLLMAASLSRSHRCN